MSVLYETLQSPFFHGWIGGMWVMYWIMRR